MMRNNKIFLNKFIFKHYFFSLLIIIFIPDVSARTFDYSVLIPDDLKKLKIKFCTSKNLINEISQSNTVGILTSNKKTKLKNRDNCEKYQVRLKSAIIKRIKGVSTNHQILTDPDEWLRYPDNFSSDDKINIEFYHSKKISVSAPWHLINRAQTQTMYQFSKRPSDWNSMVVFGQFTVEDFHVNKSIIRYALLNGRRAVDKNKIRNWVNENITALTTVYGTFPVTNLQLLVIPLGSGGEPVPWGEVMRGGGDAVHLYIDDTRTTQEFLNDWVFSHELSHLLHPRIIQSDAWFYEGMASYYQNVVRARQGLLTPNEAWKKLHAGFVRGINNTPKNKTLAEVTKYMMQHRAFMRVYWSGAAISLLADVKLRRLSNNKKSLDTTLYLFQKCCLLEARWWSALEVMKKFDELSNTSVFTDLYENNVSSTTFPNLTRVYKQLGLINRNGELEILNNAPTSIRDKIMKRQK